MVKIGIFGIGFMGMTHFRAARSLGGAVVTALCSRDPKKRAGDWRGIRGNFGPPGEVMDLSGVKTYESFHALLADPDIDLIDICSPTRLHGGTARQALQAGKHVLVEKPIALEPHEADAMVAAAEKAGRLLMVAHVLPFFPEFAFAAQTVRDGRFGELRGAHFKRVISRPDWSSEIADTAQTGGPAIDLHVHDTHFIGLIAGVPRAVFATGVAEGGAVQYLTTQYLYGEGGPCVSCSSGALAQKGRPFLHGYEIYLEQATLVYESGAVPLTVLTADGRREQPQLARGADALAAFAAELQAAVDAVAAGREPEVLGGRLARDALAMCHRECESVRSGRVVALA
jgi:predicted dehydrogenase